MSPFGQWPMGAGRMQSPNQVSLWVRTLPLSSNAGLENRCKGEAHPSCSPRVPQAQSTMPIASQLLPSPFAAKATMHLRGCARPSQPGCATFHQSSQHCCTHPSLTISTYPAPGVMPVKLAGGGTTWGPSWKAAELTRLEAKLVPPPATTTGPGLKQYIGFGRHWNVVLKVVSPPPLPPLHNISGASHIALSLLSRHSASALVAFSGLQPQTSMAKRQGNPKVTHQFYPRLSASTLQLVTKLH